MSDEIKALVEQIQVQVQSAHSFADRPLYNSLETGFRHTPLTPKEREQRYRESCRFAAQDSQEALRLIGELRAALTAQADEIERLRTLAKANNDLAKLQAGQLDQYRRAVTFDPSIVDGLETKLIEWANKIAGPKGGKSYHPDPIGVAEMCDDVMRAALKAAQEVKA